MTYAKDCTLPDELLEQVAELGLESLPELLRVVINEAMARILWKDRSPIGECMDFVPRPAPCFTIGRVVETARGANVIAAAMPPCYPSIDHPPIHDWPGPTLRGSADGRALAANDRRRH